VRKREVRDGGRDGRGREGKVEREEEKRRGAGGGGREMRGGG